jgi:hypothetical protein
VRTDFLRVAAIMNAQPGVEAMTYEEPETGALVAVTQVFVALAIGLPAFGLINA